jgi:hypothetical protein
MRTSLIQPRFRQHEKAVNPIGKEPPEQAFEPWAATVVSGEVVHRPDHLRATQPQP